MEEESTTTLTILSFLLFTTSVLSFCNQIHKKREKKKDNAHNLDVENDYNRFLLNEKNKIMLTYDQVIQLRTTYYSKSCSVSYSNTGPLMIIGVSIQYFYLFISYLSISYLVIHL